MTSVAGEKECMQGCQGVMMRIREEMALTFSLSGLRLSWVLTQVDGG